MPYDYTDPAFGSPDAMGGAEPLDLTALTQPMGMATGGPPPMASQGASAPLPPQPGKKGDKSALIQAALAALLPIAAKRGGRTAVAALLQGVQRAQAQREQQTSQQTQQDFQNQRLTANDARLASQDEANAQYRTQTLTNQQEQQRAAVMREAATAIQQADSPETVNALLGFYNPRLQTLGVRDPDTLNRLAAQIATPSALERKSAQKYITQLEKTYGTDWAQKVGTATFVLPGAPKDPATGKPKPITVQELLTKSGLTMDGVPMKPATTDKRGFTPRDITLNGKRMSANYDPDTGNYYAIGNTTTPLTGEILEYQRPTASSVGAGETDAGAIADAIIAGDQPPTLTGLYRVGAPVRSILAKKGFNLAQAESDWRATQKHIATLNGPQQLRMQQAIDNAYHSTDVIEDLAKQWEGGRFPTLNKGRLAAARQGLLGPKAQQIATQLEAQISDVTSELGNVYMGGNSPTDHALSLASKNLQANWSLPQLRSALDLTRRNLQIRGNSLKNVGVSGASTANPYAQPSAAPAGAVEEWVRDASGRLVKKGAK